MTPEQNQQKKILENSIQEALQKYLAFRVECEAEKQEIGKKYSLAKVKRIKQDAIWLIGVPAMSALAGVFNISDLTTRETITYLDQEKQ